MPPAYRYRFHPTVSFEDVEGTLQLAQLATQGLHGESRVQLDVAYVADPEQRTCVLCSSNDVGQSLNRIFCVFLTREFGQENYFVEPIERSPTQPIC